MRHGPLGTLLAIVALCGLGSCGSGDSPRAPDEQGARAQSAGSMENPLLGRWQIDARHSTGVVADVPGLVAIVPWEFTEDQAIAAGVSRPVSYAVEAERVTVIGAEGWRSVYEIVDADHVATDSPSGRVVLERLESEGR